MKRYNEQELVRLSKNQVFLLNDFADKNDQSGETLFDHLPCWIHINSYSDLGLVYMNKTGLKNFDVGMSDIKGEGCVNFLERIIHPESAKRVIPVVQNLITEGNEARVILFEQKIKYAGNSDYKNHLCFSVLNNKLKATFTATFPVNQLEVFFKEKIFDNSNLFAKYYDGFNNLTKREKEILRLISLGKTNREISELLLISCLTVKTHRRNIIYKLNTNKIADLTRVAIYFNLIDNQ